jgi:phosphoribosylformylglycinamidine cyclo-ligase
MVLSPTRTYAPVIKKMLETMHSEIHGMIHCSGGGQTKILHFIENMHIVKNNMFPLPPLFRIIHEQSGTAWEEMYRVFNMGHRFEIYTDQKNASEIISIAAGFDLDARVIGYCEASEKKMLTISSEFGTFEY